MQLIEISFSTPARRNRANRGFTLIELSIVLVIIGLIVGGVLVGRDLISAAAVRSQIAQIEQFQGAVNTFRTKYDALPGDIHGMAAVNFGLTVQRTAPYIPQFLNGTAGMGDNNQVLEGVWNISCTTCNLGIFQEGETRLFWQDLASAKLTSSDFGCYGVFPSAKIGEKTNCLYVWSGGATGGNNVNYFAISVVTDLSGYGRCSACVVSNSAFTVKQAYSIDQKVDNGIPQTGKVTAQYLNTTDQGVTGVWWAGETARSTDDTPTTNATPASSSTCFDNGNSSGSKYYSVTQNNGNGVNCTLSFKFQ